MEIFKFFVIQVSRDGSVREGMLLNWGTRATSSYVKASRMEVLLLQWSIFFREITGEPQFFLVVRLSKCYNRESLLESFVISSCILAKNSQRSIALTLASLSRFDEVIVLDTGSTDQTIDIARSFPNVRIRQAPFSGFGSLRNHAAQMACNDWILAIDSDEVLSTALQDEIHSLQLDEHAVYEIDFHNFYNGKRIIGCGWHPESHIRLYNRRAAKFSDSQIHEGLVANGLRIKKLQAPLFHTPYLSASDFLLKMQLYTDLFALENRGRRTSSFAKALAHATAAFIKSYIFKYGILMGKEGAMISFYNANMAFYKYLKLAEANQNIS